MTSNNTDYDLIIVGGGLAGVSLAISLAQQPLRVALIEAHPFRTGAPPSYDDRGIALSYGSRRIFEGLGLWPELTPRVTPIHHIHVSDQGRFGFTRLESAQEHVDALGYVATARTLGEVLIAQLAQVSNLDLISPAQLIELKLGNDHATAIIEHQGDKQGLLQSLTASLVVAADGGHSAVRQQLDIRTTQRDYGQTAIVANISTQCPHDNRAFERFTRHGPLALLPLDSDKSSEAPDHRCALVWTRSPADAERLLAASETDFLSELQQCFGQRLGRLEKVGQRHSYPLKLIRAREQVRARLALIGNAAHTLHPIAGQGFNLGLRDVATLAQVIVDAHRAGENIGALSTLEPYAQWRQRDHRKVIGFTHALVRSFSNRFPPLALARNTGLLATDLLPPLKHSLARHSMGLAGKLPRLARGLAL
ncbi:MAG: 2-octaprenyl-6-methoxyphenyl hydroxylase [Gammaproteobacteria bacterium]|nr:2-octaprenyl-6-methoxyphenyl hydroxylase [Gammaproteobacteria bacterium]